MLNRQSLDGDAVQRFSADLASTTQRDHAHVEAGFRQRLRVTADVTVLGIGIVADNAHRRPRPGFHGSKLRVAA